MPIQESHFDEYAKYGTVMTDEIFIDDRPIKDNWDLFLALNAAQKSMETVIKQSNRYKYIRETQLKACRAIFKNLSKLVCDYTGRMQKAADRDSSEDL